MGESNSTSLWAPIKWAQNKESLYVTVDLPDVTNEKVQLTNKSLKFEGMSNGQQYEVELVFLNEVDTEAKESQWKVAPRNVHFYILKKNKEDEFWPRLLESKTLEKTNVKTDWNKYVDEDDDEAAAGGDKPGFDMSALQGGGGFDINQLMQQQQAAGGNMDLPEEDDSDDDGKDGC